ncbi:uncharacterized protein LOC117173677 [Belonocnema kinseyi]|uniref:uncharacterized protein LOC117173677 n=1 Tax=Belonocnema kinseyi TaxID=2817044 RepID=UPI00143DF5EA|nr:uncharacterized protein LOC117173677 [Belonocnema kinseyi]
MGDLPEHRVTSARVFLNSGVDYAGPFKVKISCNVTGKAHLCLLVCFAIKAVHLELVMSATTEAFLNALKRFIARKGKVLNIYSDNGATFIGANNELWDLQNLLRSKDPQSKVHIFLTDNSINWRFIPASSPHMGGLWEAAVKSAKTHLRKVMGSSLLTFEELTTVFVQIVACLNSRPLIPMSSDPTEFTVLTPGHLIICESLTCIPEDDLREVPENRLTRFQHLIQIKQHFWSKWSQDYLTHLQHRSKWTSVQSQRIKPGTMVVLQDKDLPPMKWHLGRVIEMHQGKDGLTRVVSVQTKHDVTKRALNKI